MSNLKHFKLIVLALSLLLVATMFTACGDNEDKKPESSSTKTSAAPTDNSEDSSSSGAEDELGLCDIVSKDTIKSALGTAAPVLEGPESTGVQSLGDGDKGTSCIFPFEKDGTISHSFYLDLAQYSKGSFDDIKDFTATSGQDIENVGDKAKFLASQPITGGQEFTITAIKGTNVYLFVSAIPDGPTTFDVLSAKDALTKIAQAATLK